MNKIDFNLQLTDRRLRNIKSDTLKISVSTYLKDNLKQSEFNIVEKTLDLIALSACDNYKYTTDDYILSKEGLRIYSDKKFSNMWSFVARYERANNIKTFWISKEDNRNIKGENCDMLLNE